jgi:colanic acid biosynthesis glycosyl transferase WcaI
MTDPPFLGTFAYFISRRFRAPLIVISEDVFPETAVELGRLRNPVAIGVLGVMIAFYIRRADQLVAIGERMRERLIAKGAKSERIEVIPNWVDVKSIEPRPKNNSWAQEQGLADKFVVMHSGNVGHAQDLDALLRAATLLRDLEDLRIVVIGTGARHAQLTELAERLEVGQVTFLPYQPRGMLSEALSAADLHVIGLARGLSGFVVPSRLYGVLAVGRPIIAAAEGDSETARVVTEAGSGIVVPPGAPFELAGAIRSAYCGELDLEGMGRRARAYAEREADREIAFARYRALLERVRPQGRLRDDSRAANAQPE